MGWSPKFKVLICCFTLAAITVLGLIWYANALLPTPSYDVDTYQQLINGLSRHPNIVVPDEELLPTKLEYLSLYIPSRLENGAKAGYIVWGPTEDGRRLSVECQELDSYFRSGRTIPEFHPNKAYRDVPIEYYEGATALSSAFHTETCRYYILISKSSQETFSQEEKESIERLTHNIIQKNSALR